MPSSLLKDTLQVERTVKYPESWGGGVNLGLIIFKSEFGQHFQP